MYIIHNYLGIAVVSNQGVLMQGRVPTVDSTLYHVTHRDRLTGHINSIEMPRQLCN